MYLHELIPARLVKKTRFMQVPAAIVEDVCHSFLLDLSKRLDNWFDRDQILNASWRPIAEVLNQTEHFIAVPASIVNDVCSATLDQLKLLVQRRFGVDNFFERGWRECSECDTIQRRHELHCPRQSCSACFFGMEPIAARRAPKSREERAAMIVQLKRALTTSR